MADTAPATGILSSFEKIQLPSKNPSKPKGNGMMNRKSNFTTNTEQTKNPALIVREKQLYIRSKNPKKGGSYETT